MAYTTMDKPMRGDRCHATVYGDRVQSWQCTKRPTVTRGGKPYCSTHDPERVKDRKAAQKQTRIGPGAQPARCVGGAGQVYG